MRRLILAVAIAAAALPSVAEERRLVALYTYYATPEKDALTFELGDVQADPSMCKGLNGYKLAQVVATNPAMYHRVIPFGSGCWFPTNDGRVLISYVTLHNGNQVEKSIPMSKFTTSQHFTRWSDYRPVSVKRPPKSVQGKIARVDRFAVMCNQEQTEDACGKMAEAVSDVMKAGWCWNDSGWDRCR